MLPENQAVWVGTRGHQVPGQILQTAGTPRSYIRSRNTSLGEIERICISELILNFQWMLLPQILLFPNLLLFQSLVHKLELLSVPLIVYNIDYGFRPERGDVAYGHKH